MNQSFEFNILQYKGSELQQIIVPPISKISLKLAFSPEKRESNMSTVIGTNHTNQFSRFISDLKELLTTGNYHCTDIKIVFSDSLTNFDISIISIIAQFKNRFPAVEFEITFPNFQSIQAFSRFKSLFLNLREWYHDLTGIWLYEIYNESKVFKGNTFELEGVIPIFRVTKESFKNYFLISDSSWSLDRIFQSIPINDLIEELKNQIQIHSKSGKKSTSIATNNYRIIRDTTKTFNNKIKWLNNHRAFCQQYFKMMANFNLLLDSLNEIEGIDLKALGLKDFRKRDIDTQGMRELKNTVKSINEDLLKQPSFFILLFSILVNRNVEKDVGDLEEYKTQLWDLYEFSKNLFKGLRELARNIVDHTQSQTGIISGRIYSREALNEIKDLNRNDSNLLEEYFNLLKTKKLLNKDLNRQAFLDIIIFDEGQEGVISKTITNIESLVAGGEGPNNSYQNDISSLKTKQITFPDFFNTDEIKLHHHAFRSASHWGLISFTNLIKKNRGLIVASSKCYFDQREIDNCVTFFDRINTNNDSSQFAMGTYYNITLPLDKTVGLRGYNLPNISPKTPSFSAENYYNLLQYQYEANSANIKTSDKTKLLQIKILDVWKSLDSLEYRVEIKVAQAIGNQIKEVSKKNVVFIPVLDFEGLQDFLDQSKLLRFLSHIQMVIEINSLIVVNVESECISNLNDNINLNDEKIHDKQFWQPYHFTLVYSYLNDESGNRLYYTDIFGGSNVKEFKLLKNKLASTHTTIINYNFTGKDYNFSKETRDSLNSSPLFINDSGVVQNFEMIITHNFRPLFEWSLSYILNTRIEDVQNGYSGYKITDTHFRLGSKTHIQDFIYAKRIFQNSFFTDRFAFIIAKYYLENYETKRSLTILGYSEYSQMLINRVEKILSKKLNSNEINHDMVSDVDEPYLIKGEEFKENVLVVAPINTTFSTTIKIEQLVADKIRKDKLEGKCKLLTPSLNLVLVSHKNLDDNTYLKLLNENLANDNLDNLKEYPYKVFYWKHVDTENKIVTVNTNPKKSELRKQKYFISIESKWYLPDDCTSCFPEYDPIKNKTGIFNEKPLLETDKTSVTPDLLLGLPENYKYDSEPKNPNVFINQEAYASKHIVYKGNHYLHFIEPIPFYNKYYTHIVEWAEKCRKELYETEIEIFSSSVLLISPSERNNTYFVELVNRLVFDDSAIIIHYEVAGDYIENYQKFFSGNIQQSNYIFYVDDFIQSGRLFHLVNDFVRYCNKQVDFEFQTIPRNKACDGVFTLISKTDNFAKSDIVAQLNTNTLTSNESAKYNAFYSLSLNAILPEKCPLCAERKRYKSLANNSMLDIVKHYFFNKAKNLEKKTPKEAKSLETGWDKFHPLVGEFNILPWESRTKETTKQLFETFINNSFPERQYLKLLIHHELNNIISNNIIIRNKLNYPYKEYSFDDKVNSTNSLFRMLISEVKQSNSFKHLFSESNSSTANLLSVIIEELVLKVLTLQPFSNVKCLREKVFFYVLYNLDNKIDKYVNSKIPNFEAFRYIKFLLRRATILNSNYLIRSGILDKFREIYKVFSQSKKQLSEKRRKRIDYLVSQFIFFEQEKHQLKIQLDDLLDSPDSNNLILQIEKEDLKKEIEVKIKALEIKLRYLGQCTKNITYIDSSLQEFNYFFVSIVKEITSVNDAKVLKLEQNVNNLLKDINISGENDFHFLLRLLKYENAVIVKKGIDLIYKDFLKNSQGINFSEKFSSPTLRETLESELKNSLEDYRLLPLKKYLKIDDFNSWKTNNFEEFIRLLQLIYLFTVLSNDENGIMNTDNSQLEDRTKAILQNFYRITGDGDFSKHVFLTEKPIEYNDTKESGAYFVLNHHSKPTSLVSPKNMIITYATKPYKIEDNYEILSSPIDNASLSYFMLNGITNRHAIIPTFLNAMLSESKNKFSDVTPVYETFVKKPWTIWELTKEGNRVDIFWRSVRSDVYPINPSMNLDFQKIVKTYGNTSRVEPDFTEALYLPDSINSIALIRLANINLIEGKIINDGKAVIGLFGNKRYFDIERLKLSFILIPKITKFIDKHYDGDSLTAIVNEKNKLLDLEKLKHGYPRFLNNLRQQALLENREAMNKDFVSILYSLLQTGPNLAGIISRFRNILDDTKENFVRLIDTDASEVIQLGLRNENIEWIFSKIQDYQKQILINEIGGTEKIAKECKYFCKPIFDIDRKIKMPISENILNVIISEALINAKKNNGDRKQFKLWIRFYVAEGDIVFLELTNNCWPNDPKIIKILNKQSLRNTHGLGLINKISLELFDIPSRVNSEVTGEFDEELFTLVCPIAKIL